SNPSIFQKSSANTALAARSSAAGGPPSMGGPNRGFGHKENLQPTCLAHVCTGRPRLNILITSKEVVGIILRFDLNKTFKVVAVARPYPSGAFVLHQEIHIGTSKAIRFEGSPVISCPFRDQIGIRRIRID